MDPFRAATARAEASRRVIAALGRAGFHEIVAPELESLEGLPKALERWISPGVRLPQRLVVASRPSSDPARDVLAVVVHDGSARGLEVELPAVVAEALGSVGAGGFALTLRSLELARAVLLAHGLDPLHAERFLEELTHEGSHPSIALAPGETATGVTATGAAEAAGLEDAAGPLEPAQLERVILGLLGKLRFRAYGTRTPREVAARLASRLGSALPSVALKVSAARIVLEQLARAAARDPSLRNVDAVLGRAGVPIEAARSLVAVVTALERLGLKPAALELGPTGDGHGPFPGARLEPAWRLDSLGAGRVAAGGSLPLDDAPSGRRAALAAISLGQIVAGSRISTTPTQVLVVPVSEGELASAHALAREARAAGLRVELDPSGRNLRSALRAASRNGVTLVAILGEREVKEAQVLLKDLAREEQRATARATVVAELVAFFVRREAAPALAPGSVS